MPPEAIFLMSVYFPMVTGSKDTSPNGDRSPCGRERQGTVQGCGLTQGVPMMGESGDRGAAMRTRHLALCLSFVLSVAGVGCTESTDPGGAFVSLQLTL